MKMKINHFKGLYSGFAILLGLTALVFIIVNQSDDFSESENQAKATIEISKSQPIYDKSHTILPKKLHEKETLQSVEKRKDLGTLEKENSDPLLKPEGSLKTESIVNGVGLSEKELKALHAYQRQEIEQMYRNMDSIVIAPAEEGGKGIALGELLALHEQQKQAIANADDFDEIVIPALKEDSPGLTRTDLIELHKQQRLAIENVQNWDQIVIPDSEDGYPGLTWDEVATLQELQADEILEMAADPYGLAAPYPEDGGSNMTVQELKNLHMKQSVN
jgi:hypothetical protein